jgi:hypothetical protein
VLLSLAVTKVGEELVDCYLRERRAFVPMNRRLTGIGIPGDIPANTSSTNDRQAMTTNSGLKVGKGVESFHSKTSIHFQ